jgi:hypothetical protein
MFASDESKQYRSLHQDCPLHGHLTHDSISITDEQSNDIILPFPFDLVNHSEAFCNDVGRMNLDLFFYPTSSELVSNISDHSQQLSTNFCDRHHSMHQFVLKR